MDPVADVNYKPTESKEEKMDRHASVRTEDAEILWNDLRNYVNMAAQYEKYRPAFLEEPSKFDSKWDGHLGHIKEDVHRLETT